MEAPQENLQWGLFRITDCDLCSSTVCAKLGAGHFPVDTEPRGKEQSVQIPSLGNLPLGSIILRKASL